MKFTKHSLIACIAIAFFSGCGGGGGEGSSSQSPQVEDTTNLFSLYGNGVGVEEGHEGKAIFNRESLPGTPSSIFKINSLSAHACKGEGIFNPSYFVAEANKTQEVSFKIPFEKFEKCITDKIIFNYAIVQNGIDLEFSKVIFNPVYDQSKVFKESNTDPLFKHQWHLLNTGQSIGVSTPAKKGVDINVVSAWDQGYTGNGVIVGVIDSGVDMFHPDLKDNLLMDLSHNYHTGNGIGGGGINNPTPHKYLNVMDDPNTPQIDPITGGWHDHRHGTAVAGLIAAKGWNGIGTRGVAPNAKLVSYNSLETWSTKDDSEAKQLYLARKIPKLYHSNVLQHIRMANALTRNIDKIDIYNNSWGYDTPYLSYDIEEVNYEDTLKYGLFHGRGGKGAIYIKSAGNNPQSWTNFEPIQTNGYFIVVGASGSDGKASSYTTPGPNILVNAPGGGSQSEFIKPNLHQIVTTDMAGKASGYDSDISYLSNTQHFNVKGNENYDYTQLMNGTSAASPIVSGVVALMLEANSDLTWRDVRYILAHTATKNDPDNPSWKKNRANNWYSYLYGFGLVNAFEAVRLAKTFTTLNTYTDVKRLRANSSTYTTNKISNSNYKSTLDIEENVKIEIAKIKLSLDKNSSTEYKTYEFSGIRSQTNRVSLFKGTNIFYITGTFDFNSSTQTEVSLMGASIAADPEKAEKLASMSDQEPFKPLQRIKKIVDIKDEGDYLLKVDTNASGWSIKVLTPYPKSKADDIEITLTSPSKTKTLLARPKSSLDAQQTYFATQLSSYEFMDEDSRGTWELEVKDIEGNTFKLINWTLEVEGR